MLSSRLGRNVPSYARDFETTDSCSDVDQEAINHLKQEIVNQLIHPQQDILNQKIHAQQGILKQLIHTKQ
jgi:hypothetical protein